MKRNRHNTTTIKSGGKLAAFLLLLMIMSLTACKKKRSYTIGVNDSAIELIDSVYDFGAWEGDSITQRCEMRLSNVGTEPMVISKVETSCGCTAVDYPKEPIEPGDTAKLKIEYSGKGKEPGVFTKEITIFSNARTGLAKMLIKGEMK